MARRRLPLSTGQKRKRIWARTQGLGTIPAAGGKLTLDLGAQFAAEYGTSRLPVGSTIGGILLDYVIQRDGAEAAPVSAVLMGVIVTDEDTPADLPFPVTDKHVDWMYWNLINVPSTAVDATTSPWDTMGRPMSIRSKRRMDELGMHLWLIMESFGPDTYTVRITSSVLILLP